MPMNLRQKSLSARAERTLQLQELGKLLIRFYAAAEGYARCERGGIPAGVLGDIDQHLIDAKEGMYTLAKEIQGLPMGRLDKKKLPAFLEAISGIIAELEPTNKEPEAEKLHGAFAQLQSAVQLYKSLPPFDVGGLAIEYIVVTPPPLERLGVSMTALQAENLDEAIRLARELFPEDVGLTNSPEFEYRASLGSSEHQQKLEELGIRPRLNWVAYDKAGKICALTGLHTRIGAEPEGDEVWLNWFGISKEKQDVQLGAVLLDWTLEQARANGYKRIKLLVKKEDESGTSTKAFLFYEKYGFQFERMEKVNGHEEAVMSRSLN